jgi:hypothetical protein
MTSNELPVHLTLLLQSILKENGAGCLNLIQHLYPKQNFCNLRHPPRYMDRSLIDVITGMLHVLRTVFGKKIDGMRTVFGKKIDGMLFDFSRT